MKEKQLFMKLTVEVTTHQRICIIQYNSKYYCCVERISYLSDTQIDNCNSSSLYPDAPIIDFGLDLLPKYLGIKCILQITSIHLFFCLNFFFVGGKKKIKMFTLKNNGSRKGIFLVMQ